MRPSSVGKLRPACRCARCDGELAAVAARLWWRRNDGEHGVAVGGEQAEGHFAVVVDLGSWRAASSWPGARIGWKKRSRRSSGAHALAELGETRLNLDSAAGAAGETLSWR